MELKKSDEEVMYIPEHEDFQLVKKVYMKFLSELLKAKEVVEENDNQLFSFDCRIRYAYLKKFGFW
jgi:hypothetical protein